LARYYEACKGLTAILTYQGMWGCALGPLEASAQMATSRKEKKERNRMFITQITVLPAKSQKLVE